MRTLVSVFVALRVLLIADASSYAKPKPYVVFAAGEYVNLPSGSHGGLYPTFGLAWEFQLPKDWTATPAVLCEFSPEFSRWGFIGAVTFDRSIHKFVGFDLALYFVQDQERDKWSEMAVFIGPYTGFSFFLPSVTLSVGSGAVVDVRTGNWVLAPALTFSVPIGS